MIYCVEELTKSFGKHTALLKLNLEIMEPGIYGILGPNGAGKSTFLKLMLKILTPTSGSVYYRGKNIENLGNGYFKEIGAVLEGNRNLYWFLSAKENLLYYGRLMGMSDRAIRSRMEELLSVMELKGHENKKVGYCSRGMQQKVAIMAALMHSPKILFLDEPTLGLDITTKAGVISEVQKMEKRGTTVFLTTHQIDVLERLTNRLVIFEKGVCTYQGTVGSLIDSQKSQQNTEILLEYSDVAKNVLASAFPAKAMTVGTENGRLHIKVSDSEKGLAELIIRVCAENQLRILAITQETPTLEDVLTRFWRRNHE